MDTVLIELFFIGMIIAMSIYMFLLIRENERLKKIDMKKRGRKKKQVNQILEINVSQPIDQDGPGLDLKKSIIKSVAGKKGMLSISA